jgi:hypothetical protein
LFKDLTFHDTAWHKLISLFFSAAQTETLHEEITVVFKWTQSLENGTVTDINGTVMTFPNMFLTDDFNCDDFTFKLYKDWTMVYKFDTDDIKKLLCKCKGVCTFQTVAPDVLAQLRDRRLDVLSDLNRNNFIIVVSLFAAIFILGTAGKSDFSHLYTY